MNLFNILQLMNKKLLCVFFVFLFVGCSQSLDDGLGNLDDIGRKSEVIITSHSGDISIDVDNVELKGTAFDRGGIEKIEISVNGANYQPVTGKENWKINIDLQLGENVIEIRMMNSKGNVFYANAVYLYYLWNYIKNFGEPISYTSVVQNGDDIFIIGGLNPMFDFVPATSTLINYNRSSKTVNRDGLALNGITELATTVIYDNLIHVIGGLYFYQGNDFAYPKTMETCLLTGGCATGNEIPEIFRRGASAFGVIGDKVYIAGGVKGNFNGLSPEYNQYSNAILSYNFTSISWQTETVIEDDMDLAFCGSLVYNSKLYIFGGKNSNGNYQKTIYIYNPATSEVRKIENMLKYNRAGMGVTRIGSKVYLIGGENSSGFLDVVEVFDLDSETSKELRKMPFKLAYMGAASNVDSILIFGGVNNSDFTVKNTIYEYLPQNDSLNN